MTAKCECNQHNDPDYENPLQKTKIMQYPLRLVYLIFHGCLRWLCKQKYMLIYPKIRPVQGFGEGSPAPELGF